MKNIPVFMANNGTATLILQEIPRSGKAFVLLQTVLPGCIGPLLEECRTFCTDCGAKEIFAACDSEALPLPHAYDILILAAAKSEVPAYKQQPLQLLPLDDTNGALYISIYNRCFLSVSHAVSYNQKQLERIHLQKQSAYIAVTPDGVPFGIGELHGNELAAVAVLPEFRGMGTSLTSALLEKCPGPEITLTVASDNDRALGLYEKFNFHVRGKESKWFTL